MFTATFAGFSLGFNPRRRHHPRGTKRGRPRGSRRGGGNGAPTSRPPGAEQTPGQFYYFALISFITINFF